MANKDYYSTLGVSKTASKDEIKSAFRKLAHQYHPDKASGNAEKFKEINEAYSTLSDDQKRQHYDTYGSDAHTQGFGGAGHGGFGGAGFGGFDFSQFSRQQGGAGQSFEFDLGDIFGEFFGGGAGRRPRKGRNISIDIEISFKDSVFGLERELSIGKEKITIKIPAGIESGEGLRVAGKGEPGDAGPGDLIVRIWVEEHPVFKKQGLSLHMPLAIKLTTAILGGKITIDTLDGSLEIAIPSGVRHGEVLRVKGKGVPSDKGKRGDLMIHLEIDIPKKVSRAAAKIIEQLKEEGM